MSLSDGIPTLDATDIEKNLNLFGSKLGQAWKETGFVAITGHGISESVITDCLHASQAFFALPPSTKQKYWLDGGGGQRGYTPFGTETAKDANTPDQKEFWHVGRTFAVSDPKKKSMPDNIWPDEQAHFKRACQTFYTAMDSLGRKLLSAIAVNLEQTPSFFEDRVAQGNSILRLLHYPPCDNATPGERAAAHEDINVITLLVGADQAGLEIQRRDGTWIPVGTTSDAIVCNVGDMLQRITNHVLPSTTHRVVRPTGDAAKISRYSIPYFLHFAPDVKIKTLASCVTAQNPDRYGTPITAQDFLEQRLREIGLT